MTVAPSLRAWLRRLAIFAASLVAIFALSETSLIVLMGSSGNLRRGTMLFKLASWIYFEERSIIQFEPAFARYDPGLFYTLRPGDFVFANREFSTPYHVNPLGTRDDDAALIAPEVVVLGDSYAMGWGVTHEETFAHLLARDTRLRVLNAAVSSYGTAREMMLLDRVDVSKLRYVVIQYCFNDYLENQSLKDNGHLKISSEEAFRGAQAMLAKQTHYSFGGHLRSVVAQLFFRRYKYPPTRVAAAAFLHALSRGGRHNLDGVQVLLFDTDGDTEFLKAVDELKDNPEYRPFVRQLKVIDLAPHVAAQSGSSDQLGLDEHWNAGAHRAVATQLEKLLPPVAQR